MLMWYWTDFMKDALDKVFSNLSLNTTGVCSTQIIENIKERIYKTSGK